MKYNGWLIVENGDEFIDCGYVDSSTGLYSIHKVIDSSNEEEHLKKCEQLNIEID